MTRVMSHFFLTFSYTTELNDSSHQTGDSWVVVTLMGWNINWPWYLLFNFCWLFLWTFVQFKHESWLMSHLMSHDSSHKSSDSPKGKSWLKSPNLMTRPFTICGMSDSNSSRLEGVELVPKSQFEESPRPYHTAYKNTDSSVSISVSSLLVSEICHLTLSDESY